MSTQHKFEIGDLVEIIGLKSEDCLANIKVGDIGILVYQPKNGYDWLIQFPRKVCAGSNHWSFDIINLRVICKSAEVSSTTIDLLSI